CWYCASPSRSSGGQGRRRRQLAPRVPGELCSSSSSVKVWPLSKLRPSLFNRLFCDLLTQTRVLVGDARDRSPIGFAQPLSERRHKPIVHHARHRHWHPGLLSRGKQQAVVLESDGNLKPAGSNLSEAIMLP